MGILRMIVGGGCSIGNRVRDSIAIEEDQQEGYWLQTEQVIGSRFRFFLLFAVVRGNYKWQRSGWHHETKYPNQVCVVPNGPQLVA